MIQAPNLSELDWLEHGFGLRDSDVPEGIRIVRQIHSALVGDAADGTFVEGDALVSNRQGGRVGIRTADCVPILLADPATGAFAAVHAGWRGTAANICVATLRRLAEQWGVRAADVRAAIGPSIGVCCYEVGRDVASRFATWIPELEHAGEHEHLDLRAINETQLRAEGVQNIWRSDECTFCNPAKFYSYRREKEQAGRMVSFVGIKGIG